MALKNSQKNDINVNLEQYENFKKFSVIGIMKSIIPSLSHQCGVPGLLNLKIHKLI